MQVGANDGLMDDPIHFLVNPDGVFLITPEDSCGCTPSSLYRRECGIISHTREIWLCPVHAALVGLVVR